MWREEPGVRCMKFSSYHTSLILSTKPLRVLQNAFILIPPLPPPDLLFQEIGEKRVLKMSWNYHAQRKTWKEGSLLAVRVREIG